MSTTIPHRLDESLEQPESAGVARSEPVGRAKRRAGAARRSEPPELAEQVKALLPDAVIDELLAGARTEEEIVGSGGLLSQLTKRLVERAMEVELTDHLGYEPHQEPPGGTGNTRNGSTAKTLLTEHGEVRIDTPRDRAGTFEPQIVRKRQRRFEGFDEKILALYSRGLSTRDIEAHLQEIYGVKVGRDWISKVTDAVMDDARAWQTRPLEDVYPVLFLDALVLKIRDGGSVQRRACYLALAIGMDGERDVLGMWFQANEGAKFWMQVLTDLKQRGVQHILISCVDGLKGFPAAIEAVFPKTTVQTCIVHLIRHSLRYVPRRQYDAVVKDLKPIYTAIDADAALVALETFEEKWGAQLPVIGQAWRDAWDYVIAFMAFEPDVRRVVYTTNAIEALNRQLRKALKTKGSFPSEDAARKLIYHAIQTPCRSGPGHAAARKRCSRSRSNSDTDCPTDHQSPPTQADALGERSTRVVEAPMSACGTCRGWGSGPHLLEAQIRIVRVAAVRSRAARETCIYMGQCTGPLDVVSPPQTAVSMMHGCRWLSRAVLSALAVSNLVAITVLWLAAGGVDDVHSSADALSSAGRIAALWGGYLSLVAVLLLARMPVLERVVGFGRLTVWHRYAASGCLVMLLAHAALTTVGLTLGDRTSVSSEVARLISEYPGVITATAGLVLLVAVAALSVRPVWRRLRYETWYLAHLYTYLAIALAFSHQIATGKDFVGAPAARVYWTSLFLATLGALVLFRVLRPVSLAVAHRLRVERVIEEVPGVVSIEITGRRLDRLRVRPGQFFLWRFLTPDYWWQAHPFSLSAAPDGRRLRITVGAVGDFSTALRDIRPGTFVLAEGPLGAFTAAAAHRQRIALIAGGTGITAIRALLESINGDVTLLYRPGGPDGHILFRDELDELASIRGVRVLYLTGEHRMLSSAVITRLVPDIAWRDVFVCGSPPMVAAARDSLIEAGCSRRHIFSERFGL